MGDSWDAAYEDELHVSQEIADLVEEACDARSSSSDLEEEELQQKCWWIAMLEGALADLHYTWPTIQKLLGPSLHGALAVGHCPLGHKLLDHDKAMD